MKKTILALLLAAPITAWSQLITVNSFSDVQYWTGSGSNSAALVLEFGSSATQASLAWGYRWDGTTTASSMLFALAGTITGASAPSPLLGSDSRLAVDVSFFSGFGGYFINTISYNQVGLPSPWTQSMRLIKDDYFGDGTYPTLYSLNSAGTWNSSFVQAQVGMSTLALSNGMWVGFVQSDGADDPRIFAQPVAAVPEPGTIGLLCIGAGVAAFGAYRRNRKLRS